MTIYELTDAQISEIRSHVADGETLTYSTETVVPQIKGYIWSYSDYPTTIKVNTDIQFLTETGVARIAWVEMAKCIRDHVFENETVTVQYYFNGTCDILVCSKAQHEERFRNSFAMRPDWEVRFHNPMISNNEPTVRIRRA